MTNLGLKGSPSGRLFDKIGCKCSKENKCVYYHWTCVIVLWVKVTFVSKQVYSDEFSGAKWLVDRKQQRARGYHALEMKRKAGLNLHIALWKMVLASRQIQGHTCICRIDNPWSFRMYVDGVWTLRGSVVLSSLRKSSYCRVFISVYCF